jgi:1-acyl-sn-glycerol-3-phosphate acyltransferase
MNDAERPDDLSDLDDDLDAVRDALADLRQDIRRRLGRRVVVEASEDAPGEASSRWLELFAALRAQIANLGMSERSGEVDAFGMAPESLQRMAPLLDFLVDHYWRVGLRGVEQLPEKGPCLLVANHSGLLPWDGLVLAHLLGRGLDSHQRPRFFVPDWLMTLPFAMPTLTRLGAVRACRENAEWLLRNERYVIVFPEGAKGSTKVFRERYQVQRFGRGGVVRLALETGAPIIPIGVVGAEESHPILFKSARAGRALGVPFLPVTPTFPLLGPLGALPLPTKWVVRIGEPLALPDSSPEAARNELLISRLNEELRQKIQDLVHEALDARESVWS